jgi:hypothetical protein
MKKLLTPRNSEAGKKTRIHPAVSRFHAGTLGLGTGYPNQDHPREFIS